MMTGSRFEQGTTPDHNGSVRLYQAALAALALSTAYFIWRSGGDLSLTFVLGLTIFYLSAIPALLWAKNRSTWFPAFEITQLTCVAFYAIPLLNSHRELAIYRSESVAEAAGLVIAYLAAANLAFFSQRNPVRASRWANTSLVPDEMLRYLPIGLLLNTVYLYFDIFTTLISYDIAGSVRALFFGLGIVSTFVLSRLWGLGQLDHRIRGFFVLNLAAQIVFLLSQLYLVRAISILALGLIAYSAARRRVPWLLLGISLPILALLHTGKSEMRRVYWEEKRPAPTLGELPAYFSEWVGYSLDTKDEEAKVARSGSLFERASLIQMLCMSVDRVPELKPFLNGESYVDIPALVIPRIIWPDKPSSLMANVRLGVHFDLINPDEPFKVSIAFGMIAEAYINFGIFGPPILGLILGALFKRVAILASGAQQFSALGILMILLTAWSFQAEFVLATWLSSLFQAAVVCIGMPLVYRKITHI